MSNKSLREEISTIQDCKDYEHAIEIAIPLLKEEISSLATCTALLERLRADVEGEVGTKKILSAICYHGHSHFSVTEQVLQLLQISPHPEVLISFIPQLVGRSCISDLSTVVSEFASLLRADRALLVPILGALFDLPLTQGVQAQAWELARDALSVVEEEDLPVVVQTVLRHCPCPKNKIQSLADRRQHKNAIEALQAVRRETIGIDPDIRAPLAHAIKNATQSNPEVAKLWINCLSVPEPEDKELALTTMDLLMVLHMVGDRRHVRTVGSLLLNLAAQKRIPFDAMHEIGEDPSWNTLLLPLVTVAFWLLLEAPSHLAISCGQISRPDLLNPVVSGARKLLLTVFCTHVAIRSTILTSILTTCSAPSIDAHSMFGAVQCASLLVDLTSTFSSEMAAFAALLADHTLGPSPHAANKKVQQLCLIALCQLCSEECCPALASQAVLVVQKGLCCHVNLGGDGGRRAAALARFLHSHSGLSSAEVGAIGSWALGAFSRLSSMHPQAFTHLLHLIVDAARNPHMEAVSPLNALRSLKEIMVRSGFFCESENTRHRKKQCSNSTLVYGWDVCPEFWTDTGAEATSNSMVFDVICFMDWLSNTAQDHGTCTSFDFLDDMRKMMKILVRGHLELNAEFGTDRILADSVAASLRLPLWPYGSSSERLKYPLFLCGHPSNSTSHSSLIRGAHACAVGAALMEEVLAAQLKYMNLDNDCTKMLFYWQLARVVDLMDRAHFLTITAEKRLFLKKGKSVSENSSINKSEVQEMKKYLQHPSAYLKYDIAIHMLRLMPSADFFLGISNLQNSARSKQCSLPDLGFSLSNKHDSRNACKRPSKKRRLAQASKQCPSGSPDSDCNGQSLLGESEARNIEEECRSNMSQMYALLARNLATKCLVDPPGTTISQTKSTVPADEDVRNMVFAWSQVVDPLLARVSHFLTVLPKLRKDNSKTGKLMFSQISELTASLLLLFMGIIQMQKELATVENPGAVGVDRFLFLTKLLPKWCEQGECEKTATVNIMERLLKDFCKKIDETEDRFLSILMINVLCCLSLGMSKSIEVSARSLQCTGMVYSVSHPVALQAPPKLKIYNMLFAYQLQACDVFEAQHPTYKSKLNKLFNFCKSISPYSPIHFIIVAWAMLPSHSQHLVIAWLLKNLNDLIGAVKHAQVGCFKEIPLPLIFDLCGYLLSLNFITSSPRDGKCGRPYIEIESGLKYALQFAALGCAVQGKEQHTYSSWLNHTLDILAAIPLQLDQCQKWRCRQENSSHGSVSNFKETAKLSFKFAAYMENVMIGQEDQSMQKKMPKHNLKKIGQIRLQSQDLIGQLETIASTLKMQDFFLVLKQQGPMCSNESNDYLQDVLKLAEEISSLTDMQHLSWEPLVARRQKKSGYVMMDLPDLIQTIQTEVVSSTTDSGKASEENESDNDSIAGFRAIPRTFDSDLAEQGTQKDECIHDPGINPIVQKFKRSLQKMSKDII